MRGWARSGLLPFVMLASACLGIVDVASDPAPAELSIESRIAPDDADPSLVQVGISAVLEPGYTLRGERRRVVSELLGVESRTYEPTSTGSATALTWQASDGYPDPGPEAIRLVLPALAGLPRPREINMRVRVDVTPGDTIELRDGEDLVVTVATLTSPAEVIDWFLQVWSPSIPVFRLHVGGSGHWPSEIRVPAVQIPADAYPLTAELRIRWSRSLTLSEITPPERYGLHLGSDMTVRWTVVSVSP